MKKTIRTKKKKKTDENICPDCGNVLTVCIGERNDCSYGEYLECSNCGYTN